MTIRLFILLLLLPVIHLCAQSAEDLKLMQQIQQHPQEDTFRVNRLNELSFRTTLPLTIRDSIATVALALSKKIKYAKGEMDALGNLGDVAVSRGNIQKGLSMMQRAYEIAVKENNKKYQAMALNRKAIYKLNTNEGNTAIDDLMKALSIAENLPDKSLLARTQSAIGSFYSLIVINYPLSMEWLLKSIQTAEKAHCTTCLEASWSTLANLYSLLGDQENALIYLQKALQSIEERGAQPAGNTLNTIGERYRLLGKYPEAIRYYEKALDITKDSLSREIYISNIADVYVRMDSLAPAFQSGFTSLRLAEKLNDVIGVAWINGILARAYLKKNLPDSALYHAQKGMQVAQEVGSLEYMRDNAKALAQAYLQKENYKDAYHFQDMYITFRDSMLNENVTNKTNLLQFNYEKEKTQAHIDLLQEQKKNQRALLIAALVVLGLIILSAILLLRNNRQKQKANKNLAKSVHNMDLLGNIGRDITSSLSLEAVIHTVYEQVNKLMDANIFGLGIYNASTKMIEFPSTYESGEALAPYGHGIEDKNRFASVCFTQNKEIIMGNLGEEYKDFVQNIQTPHQGKLPESLIFLPLVSKGKNSGVITVQSFQKNAYTDYHLFMLRNIANYTSIALENAHAYDKLNRTLKNLKETQSQLIQSEKMASLGELTAGIAHEIQNPLNFVNNFSEVNKDLIKEMNEEIEKGNINEVKELAADITNNEEKIIFHGKRADSIVKSMLQHSRNSSGNKEPTDINNLCDECLRLAFHGMRAKDKSFNSGIDTHFNTSLGSINVVPQDLGRVLLNLLTNAFYEVNEKSKHHPDDYKPLVSIGTRKEGNTVQIEVRDNGNGIPMEVQERVFQPFYTTKPTGKGTGLGLSLSYDIVKLHGGDISIDSIPGASTTFKIILPIKN